MENEELTARIIELEAALKKEQAMHIQTDELYTKAWRELQDMKYQYQQLERNYSMLLKHGFDRSMNELFKLKYGKSPKV